MANDEEYLFESREAFRASKNTGKYVVSNFGSSMAGEGSIDEYDWDDRDKDNLEDDKVPKQESENFDDTRSELSLPIGSQEQKYPKKEIFTKEDEYENEKFSVSFMETLVSQVKLIEDKIKKAAMTLALDNFQVSDLPDVMSPLSSRPVSPCSSLYTRAGSVLDEKEKLFPLALRSSKTEIAQTMNALMDIKETPSKLYISIKDLRDEVFLQSVNCNLLVAVVAGLPNCGKSKVIRGILEHVLLTPANIHQEGSLQSYVENGLSSYGVVIVGRQPFTNLIWLPESRSSMHMFAFGSVILHNSLLQGQQVELVDTKLKEGKRFKGFRDDSLDSHLHCVYDDLDILMSHCELNPEIRKIMPSGITAVNIIDAAFSHAIYDFLTIAARYCHRQFGFIFLDFNRDVPSLNEKPHGIKQHTVIHPGSCLFYLIRFAAVSYFSTNSTSSLIIALQHNDNLPDEEVQSGTAILKKAINDEIGRQNLPPDLIQDVLVINPSKKDDLMRFKIELEKFVKGRRSAFLDLKLAFVFFRSFLLNDLKYAQKLYVSFKEIQSLSQRLSIEKSEFDVFLRTYTEFGSILYMKDILPDVVILQPAAFVNCIKKLFDHIAEGFTDGIILKSKASRVLVGTNAVMVVIPFLIKSRLAVELVNSDIHPHRVQLTPSPFLFVPSVRPDYLENDHDPTSLYISYSSKIAPPNMPGAFLEKMLKLGSLIPTNFQNSISLNLRNGTKLDVTFYPWLIRVKLGLLNPRKQYEDTCKDILLQCISALSEIEVLFPDVTYDFALRCSFQKAITYEYITNSSESPRLCTRCQHNLQHKVRRYWSSAVKSVEQAKDKAVVSMEALTEIAGKMATVKGVDDNLIMKVFSITAEEQAMLKATYYSDRHVYLLSVLMTWVSKIGKDNVTKRKLSNNLFRANPQFINIL